VGYQKKPLRILQASVDFIQCAEAESGTLLEVGSVGFLRIQTGKGSLKVFKIQLPGRDVVSGTEFANGQRLKPGFHFENLR
jgi:methionyl-tRNA formyltransferase